MQLNCDPHCLIKLLVISLWLCEQGDYFIPQAHTRNGVSQYQQNSWKVGREWTFVYSLAGIRLHFPNLVKDGRLTTTTASKAQLGLGHSYSRAKVKFNVHRVDNMIIQSIALLDQLDKDINTFSMRIRSVSVSGLEAWELFSLSTL